MRHVQALMLVAGLALGLGGCSTIAGASPGSPDANGDCPVAPTPGAACATPPGETCFHSGDVCGQDWGDSSFFACTCVLGEWQCDDPYPFTGDKCTYATEQECGREGPGCNDWGQPPGADCVCTPGGTWQCTSVCQPDAGAADAGANDGGAADASLPPDGFL